MNLLEIKDFTGSVKDVDTKGRVITGYLSSFGNKDHDGDIIMEGAYTKSIAERKNQIFFLNQHNWKQPLTKFNVLQEDEKGLYFESMPLPETSYGNDVMKLYDAGVLKEHSVGFITVKSDFKKEEDTRYIKEIKLYEGSVVTLGANSNTPFTGFKSSIKDIDDEANLIYKAIRNGDYTDETFSLLQLALKQLQLQAFELGKKSLTEPTIVTPEPIIKETEILKNYLQKWN